MLITHVGPSELWGKKVYDTDGRFLGAVVAIGSRRDVVRKVVVQRTSHGAPFRVLPPADARVVGSSLVVPIPQATTNPLARFIEADPRVRRWRRVEFADDGGALVVVELFAEPGGIADEAIARELESAAARALPKLTWVRVQVA
jgi:sporulation protein YlmC with PRC-barrel domain